jgi:hypothetical protein
MQNSAFPKLGSGVLNGFSFSLTTTDLRYIYGKSKAQEDSPLL